MEVQEDIIEMEEEALCIGPIRPVNKYPRT